ncbi:MAG: Gx transporter family protein, partial [Finegoldia magna]|nr:Gx transporter family protein [Finegoldia magna]
MKRLHIPILTAVALVVSLIESMIPLPIVMPGAKLGLSNIVILTCLIVFG